MISQQKEQARYIEWASKIASRMVDAEIER